MTSAERIEWVVRLGFAITGIVHALPLAGLLGRGMLERSYGVSLGEGQDLVILMQHRALLFGLLACACFGAAALPAWRTPVGLAALVSMLGFAGLAAWQAPGAALVKVMWIDIGAALLLIMSMVLPVWVRSG